MNATPKTAPITPCHLARSRGEKRSPTIAIAVDIRPPAPIPWNARKRINWSIVCDVPQSSEPIKKTERAKIRIGLRPYISESLP